MKTCKVCGIEKPLDDFYFNRGNNAYIGVCKVCRREQIKQQRKWYARKAAAKKA